MSEKSPLDPAAEREALRTMATTIIAALGQFPDDISTDQSRLQNTNITDPNEQLSIAFRIEKKQLLLNALRHIASKIRDIKL